MSAPKITVREMVEASEWGAEPHDVGWHWWVEDGEREPRLVSLQRLGGEMIVLFPFAPMTSQYSPLAKLNGLWRRAIPPAVPEHLRERTVGL